MVVGGVHGGGGYVWWVAYMARGACIAGGMCGRGACMAGGHVCQGRYYGIRSMSGCYASYWNAFLSRPLYMSTWMSHK